MIVAYLSIFIWENDGIKHLQQTSSNKKTQETPNKTLNKTSSNIFGQESQGQLRQLRQKLCDAMFVAEALGG